MKELVFRKMVCSAGHESRPYAPEEPLPRRCPVCNQPYDRRNNRPVLCYEDGTVPEEDMRSLPPEQEAYVPQVKAETEAPVQPAEPVMPAMSRRRSLSDGMEAADGFRRGRTVQPSRERQGEAPSQSRESASGFVLYCCGSRIPVPAHGCYLGREEAGQELFAINLQVSRKHAFAEPVRVNRSTMLSVRDAGSLNGTFADNGNGRKRILPGEEIMLRPGDRLWLANQLLAVEEDKS